VVKRRNRPIHLGEFGVYDKAEMSRVRYLDFVTREAEKRGWAGLLAVRQRLRPLRHPRQRWIEPVRDALIPPAK
jgi:hypothetical protein